MNLSENYKTNKALVMQEWNLLTYLSAIAKSGHLNLADFIAYSASAGVSIPSSLNHSPTVLSAYI